MSSIIYDFAAIAKLTKAFAEEPPQNEVKPQPEPAYSYSSGDLGEQPDYGMYAGLVSPPTELIGFGRISCDPKDEGYAAYAAMIASHGHPRLFLDGLEVKDAVTAQPGRNGWVYRHQTTEDGHSVFYAGGDLAMETVHGYVQVFKTI